LSSNRKIKLSFAQNSNLTRVLKLAKPVAGLLAIGLLGLALGSGINLLFPYLIRALINNELGYSLQNNLSEITLILILLFGVQAIFFYIRHFCFYSAGFQIVSKLKSDLFSSILLQDVKFFDSNRVGDLLSRLSADTELVQRAVTVNLSVALRYVIQVIGGTVLMFLISVKLTLVLVLLIPLIVLASIFWGKKLRSLSRKMQNELGEASVVAEETISSIKTVRIFAGEIYEEARYREQINFALATGIARSKIAASFSSVMVFFVHSSIAVMIWLGGILISQGSLSLGDMTAFLLYGVIVAVSFGFLAGTWDEFLRAVGASERIFEIIDLKPDILNNPSGLKPDSGKCPKITFSNVSFSYPSRPDSLVLNNISFEISPGEMLALVGPSGSGKSTIASLIPRFYDPKSGQILFNDCPINSLSLEHLRKEISYVPQTPQIFSCSIGENIRYGRLDATENEVIEAAKTANIDQFISSLADGYNTRVGDKGIMLSGGERQRVAIARAILKNANFLILDEATSSLDSENEFLIKQALERLFESRTTMVIAHRLSTILDANRVLVIKDGQIKQSGVHQELMNQDGLYKTLVEYQFLGQ
jgi:ATP-binding cassette subfamily B protein